MTVNCFECREEIKRGTNKVQCLLCKYAYHSKCGKLKDEEAKCIYSNTNIHFLCNNCKIRDILVELREVKTMLSSFSEMIGKQQETLDRHSKLLNENKKNTEEISCHLGNANATRKYSEVLKRKPEHIIVRPIVEQISSKTKTELQEKIEPEKLAAGISNIKCISNGGVLISCEDASSRDKIKHVIQDEYKDVFVTEDPVQRKPLLILVNAEEMYVNKENEEIENCLRDQNDILSNINSEKFKVIRKYLKKNKKNCGNIILEMEKEVYTEVMKNEMLNLGWRRCKVFDHINVLRCFKCGRYGHIAEKCRNEVTCFKCAGRHETKNCNSDVVRCVNCSYAKEKLKLNVTDNHTVYDRTCTYFNKIVEREMNKLPLNQ